MTIDLAALAPTIIPAVITGVLSAYLTAALAFSRTKKEKLWDARFASYQSILNSLHEMGIGYDNMFEAAMKRKDISTEDRTDFREKYLKGKRALEQFVYTSDLLLDRKVKTRIQKLFADIDKAQATTDWNSYLDGSSGAIWDCVRDVTNVARGHLEI